MSGVDVTARRARLVEAMTHAGLDVLVLGRPANIAYVTGARGLATTGTRPFGPGAVVVRSGDTIELYLTTDSDGAVPADIPRSNLFGMSWNPGTLVGRVGMIPGITPSTVVGVDGMSPGLVALLPGRLVDASHVLRNARRVKGADELACIRRACAIAEAGLSAVVGILEPGISPGRVNGVFRERIAALGVTVPGLDVCPPGDAPLEPPAPLHAAVQWQGYEGGIGRTWSADPALATRWQAAIGRVVEACRPGATGADVLTAWAASGEELPGPARPLVYGLGLGVEPPVFGAGIPDDGDRLEAGMVVAVQGWVGPVFGRETVLVRPDGPEVLTRFPSIIEEPSIIGEEEEDR